MDDNSRDACTYASLILIDDNLDVTSDKINAILKSANIDFVPAFLPGMFSKILSNNPRQLLMSVGNSPVAAPVATTITESTEAAPSKNEVKESKQESSSESDADMGFGLFD